MNPRQQVVAIVPMRHQSERVNGKNFRPFAGRPLYHHIVDALAACDLVSTTVIDTDSPVIADDATRHFPAVLVVERPVHLRAPGIPMNDVLLYDLGRLEGEFFLQTHSTNPLVRTSTIRCAITAFFDAYPANDSLFSVTRRQTRFWTADGVAVNHDPAVLLRTQDLPPIFEENSNLYIFSRHSLAERRNRIGARPLLFEIDRLEAWDIDDETDFRIAELIQQARRS